MRVEKHEGARHFSIAVEDGLAGRLRDVDDPLESLYGEVGDVHVDAAVSDHDAQPNEVRLRLGESLDFLVFEVAVDLSAELGAEVLGCVGVVELPNLEAVQRRGPANVVEAELVGDLGVSDARVPVEPDDPRQSVLRLARCVHRAPLGVAEHVRLAAVCDQVLAEEGLRVDEVPFGPSLGPLKQLVDSLLERNAGYVAHRPSRCLHICQVVVGNVFVDLLFRVATEEEGEFPGKVALVHRHQAVFIDSKGIVELVPSRTIDAFLLPV